MNKTAITKYIDEKVKDVFNLDKLVDLVAKRVLELSDEKPTQYIEVKYDNNVKNNKKVYCTPKYLPKKLNISDDINIIYPDIVKYINDGNVEELKKIYDPDNGPESAKKTRFAIICTRHVNTDDDIKVEMLKILREPYRKFKELCFIYGDYNLNFNLLKINRILEGIKNIFGADIIDDIKEDVDDEDRCRLMRAVDEYNDMLFEFKWAAASFTRGESPPDFDYISNNLINEFRSLKNKVNEWVEEYDILFMDDDQ